MAKESSDLEHVFALSWKINFLPVGTSDFFARSSNFYLINAEWRLQFNFSPCSNGINSVAYYHELTLLQNERKNLEKPFCVTTFSRFKVSPISSSIEGKETFLTKTLYTTCELIGHGTTIFLLGELDVVCIFHDVTSSSINSETFWRPDLESLTSDYSSMLKDEIFSDVKLRCGDESIPAHKTVLSARSAVFSAMFRSGMAESESGVVHVSDLDAEVLKLFLAYIYTGTISEVKDELIPSLYAAADKYGVHALKKTCSDLMLGGLNDENCVHILALADKHSDDPFKSDVVAFICRNEKILLSDVWVTFSKEYASLAVEVLQIFAEMKIEV